MSKHVQLDSKEMADEGSTDDRPPEAAWRRILPVAWRALAAALAVSGGSFALISYNESDGTSGDSGAVSMNADVRTDGSNASGSPGSGSASVTQDVHGAGSQDHSRRVNVVFNEFRLATLRSTADLAEPQRDHRDQVLRVIHDLLENVDQEQAPTAQVDDLGRQLANVIEDAPMSRFQLTTDEFTLRPGTAYFLPGSIHAVSLVGPRDVSDPNSVYVRRDGRKTPMNIGSVWNFAQGDEHCRLVLHDISENFSAATFSYTCLPE